MFSFRALLAAAPLLALAVAQNIAFTSTPGVAQAGQSYNISWAGGDGTGATLTLRRGSPQNLRTLDTLADGVTVNYYVWTVPSSLESGDDYALQITQGQADINYSGLFSVTGGSASSSSSNSTSSTSVPTVSTATGNSTMSITSAASASGTGTAMERNSTFSTASLTSSSSGSTFGETTSSRTSASRTSAAATQSTSAPSTNGAENLAGSSSAALILGIVAAVMLH